MRACSSFTLRDGRALKWSGAAYNHPGSYFIEGCDLCNKDSRLGTFGMGLILVVESSRAPPPARKRQRTFPAYELAGGRARRRTDDARSHLFV